MTAALLAPRRPRRPSLTALIDVVFILLLFFMVTSVFQREAAVALPTASGAAPQDAPAPQVLAVNAAGQVRAWGDSNVARELNQLTPSFWGRFDASRPLVVRPAADCPVEKLMAVLEAARAEEFGSVSLGPTWEAQP